MMESIHITDLSLLKITKVKNWAINFDYDGKHYLLHGNSEIGEGSWNDLYERELDENGYCKLKHLNTVNGKEWLKSYYIKPQKGKTIVYNNIDKGYFVLRLTRKGLATGVMEQVVTEERKQSGGIRAAIKIYNDRIDALEKTLHELE